MKSKTLIYLCLFICISFFSCYKNVLIPATKDASLSCLLPDNNIDGKKEVLKGEGFGLIKAYKEGYITYPIMYLGSREDYDFKESFIVGGFDLSNLKGKVIHASLKFYINYSSKTLKRVIIFIRPIKDEWDENKIKYLDIYEDAGIDSKLMPIVESEDNKCSLIVFDINSNEENKELILPFTGSYKTVSIDVTGFVKDWVKNPELNHGFLIDPLWMNDKRYCTTDLNNIISDFGIIEIVPTEWFKWEGNVPDYFYIKKGKWFNIKNRAKNKIKYIPRLEIKLSK